MCRLSVLVLSFLLSCSSVLTSAAPVSLSDYTYSDHLGAQTRYHPLQNSSAHTPLPSPSCHLVQFNFLSRHGNRNPSASDIALTEALQLKLHAAAAQLTAAGYGALANWVSPFADAQPDLLVDDGMVSEFEVAQRLMRTVPGLADNSNYWRNINSWTVQSTNVSRVSQSAFAFFTGFLDGYGPLRHGIYPAALQTLPSDEDPLLRFFENCSHYQKYVLHNSAEQQQVLNWHNRVVPAIAQRLSTLLGGLSLSVTDVVNWYTACTFTLSVSEDATLCSVFTPQEFELLAYGDDLQKYYDCGYGVNESWQIATKTLQFYLQTMQQAREFILANTTAAAAAGSAPKSTYIFSNLKFGHAETIGPFAAILGLYKDSVKLTADLPLDQVLARKWRSDRILYYNSNFQFQLYQCPAGHGATPAARAGTDQFFVRLLHNEQEMTIPGCNGQVFCPLDTVTTIYSQATSYDYDAICSSNSSASSTQPQQSQSSQPLKPGPLQPQPLPKFQPVSPIQPLSQPKSNGKNRRHAKVRETHSVADSEYEGQGQRQGQKRQEVQQQTEEDQVMVAKELEELILAREEELEEMEEEQEQEQQWD